MSRYKIPRVKPFPRVGSNRMARRTSSTPIRLERLTDEDGVKTIGWVDPVLGWLYTAKHQPSAATNNRGKFNQAHQARIEAAIRQGLRRGASAARADEREIEEAREAGTL